MKDYLSRVGKYPAPARLALFLLLLLAVWGPIGLPLYWLVPDPNWAGILATIGLYAAFIFLARLWGRYVYGQPQILRLYGLEFSRQNGQDLFGGLGLGLFGLLSLLTLETLLGWLEWQVPNLSGLPLVMGEGLLVALGVGFAEELLFRGWLLDELQRDYSPGVSLGANATIFAVLHFIKPWEEIIRTFPAFPGLVLLGLTLGWAKRSREGRLGKPIGFHAGLVWGYYIINVGQLVQYSGAVPAWITGLDNNPLAGVMGLLFLGAIATAMYRTSPPDLAK